MTGTTAGPAVRAFFEAVTVDGATAPYDRIQLKIYYPSAPEMSMDEVNMGLVPADAGRAPFPIAIMMPGTNVPMESYSWLATALAERGIVTVLYSWIKEDMPGFVCLSPGIDLAYMKPDTYGSAPMASAVPSILKMLKHLNNSGILAGLLDVDTVFFGGHSAGGSVALLNANREWFPQLCGVFSYAAHSGASTMLGFAEDTMLQLASNVPMLLMAGDRDGVIAASSFRYGDSDETAGACARIDRTFNNSITSERGDAFLMHVRGANHFSFTHPCDPSTGRAFLDWPVEGDEDTIRADMAAAIGGFIAHYAAEPHDNWIPENRPQLSLQASK